jgi:hypothetical protein
MVVLSLAVLFSLWGLYMEAAMWMYAVDDIVTVAAFTIALCIVVVNYLSIEKATHDTTTRT